MSRNAIRATIFLGLCLILAASDLFPSEPQVPFTITLEGSRSPRPETYLLGEPIRMRWIVENPSDEPVMCAGGGPGIGFMTGDPMQLRISGAEPEPSFYGGRLSGLVGHLSAYTLEPGERSVGSLEPPWILGPGRYEIWIEYAPAEWGWDNFMEREGIPKLRIESNRFRFEIVEPTGIDAQAFDKYSHKPYKRLTTIHELREKLVREFPTSVYAGWVISGGPSMTPIGPLPPPRTVPDIPSPERVREHLREKVRKNNEARRIRYAARIEELSDYLSRRPDFAGADEMRIGIAWLKLYLGEVEDAQRIVDQLTETEDLPFWLREQCPLLRERVLKRIEEMKASDDKRST